MERLRDPLDVVVGVGRKLGEPLAARATRHTLARLRIQSDDRYRCDMRTFTRRAKLAGRRLRRPFRAECQPIRGVFDVGARDDMAAFGCIDRDCRSDAKMRIGGSRHAWQPHAPPPAILRVPPLSYQSWTRLLVTWRPLSLSSLSAVYSATGESKASAARRTAHEN